MKKTLSHRLAFMFFSFVISLCAIAESTLKIEPLAERKVSELPTGELYWRIENVDSLEQANAAAGTWSLVAQAVGKVWLFTLGPAGAVTTGAHKVAEVGPIPRVVATEYLLGINDASGPPGNVTAILGHPGSEAFFVLAGEQSILGANGTLKVSAGQAEAGHGADLAMQVSSSGSVDLHAFVMFLVDANRPFSSPASFH